MSQAALAALRAKADTNGFGLSQGTPDLPLIRLAFG